MKRIRLINERKKRNLNSNELAQILGVSKSMVSHIENNRCNPSWKVQKRLEQFFGIPASELLAEGEEEVSG
jgi:putative transcriptional regulator